MNKHVFALALATTLASAYSQADHPEEILVTGTHDTHHIDVSTALNISPDTSQLLKSAPGANVNGNGPLTGIPQYRGMYGARVATALDGRQVAPSGPNWMDPPLSYAAAGQLESLELYRGIAPVSVAQESIGGAVEVRTYRGEFTDSEDFDVHGNIIANTQSVNGGTHLNGAIYANNANHRIKAAAMTESGDDAEFPSGNIVPSEYERQRYDLGYGIHSGAHQFQLDWSRTDTGETGTAALPMDIDYIEGDLYSASYDFQGVGDFTLRASLYGAELKHGMTNYHLRNAPPAPNWRRNIASSDNAGFDLNATLTDNRGRWTFGIDGFEGEHNSDIDNPNNPMFFVVNFNNARKDVLGGFIERQQTLDARWRTELGLRFNHVTMDADEVDGTPAMMMPPAQMLRDAFNNANRQQTDNNTDLVARLWFSPDSATSWYVGAAQKNRSPSYQERYLWLPLEATAGLADGFTYTGNIELDSEVSRQLELGVDFINARWRLTPRIFYSRVDDYIQGTPSEMAPALMFMQMMNGNDGKNRPAPLQFNNVDAELYGFDMDWALTLDGHWSVSGIVNVVRGKRRDISDNLYRIAPANASFAANYSGHDWAGHAWTASAETAVYDAQNNVSATNGEQKTAGYALLNLRATWQATPALELAAGIDNVFDKGYRDHLGGYNRTASDDIAALERLPGYGRNVFARLAFSF